MRLWVWQQCRCELPPDWEMLQFSRRTDQGRCQFADRYQIRLELSWRTVAGTPDLARTLSDYRSYLTVKCGLKTVSDVTVAGWRGLEGEHEGVWTTRFGTYLPAVSRLVELVWLWPARPDRDLLARVLPTVRAAPAAHGLVHWRAFGLDLQVADGLKLDTCQVAPGLAELTFADPKQPRRLDRFDRLGMVREWLHVPVATWLRAQAPPGAQLDEPRQDRHAGHECVTLRGTAAPTWGERLRGRRTAWLGRAWLCPHDGRLYCHRWHGPPAAAPTQHAPAPLCCCDAWGRAA